MRILWVWQKDIFVVESFFGDSFGVSEIIATGSKIGLELAFATRDQFGFFRIVSQDSPA